MTELLSNPCTAFQGNEILIAGTRLEVALATKRAVANDPATQVLVFDDATGRIVDLDLRGSDAEIAERLSVSPASRPGRFRPPVDASAEKTAETRGRGRPKLGVVSREVTLLPRHWDWLAAQPGGASATLRRIVDEARRSPSAEARQRAAREAAYNVMQAIAGDLAGYEDALRALFAGDKPEFEHHTADWPADIRSYTMRLGFRTSSAPEGLP